MAMPFPQDIDLEAAGDPAEATARFDIWLGASLARARARGMAEGIEMLGVGVVLIDANGRVLKVGPRGRFLMAGWLSIVADHVVAERPGDARAVSALVGSTIAGRPSPSGIRLRAGIDAPVLVLRGLMVSSRDGTGPSPHAAILLDEA